MTLRLAVIGVGRLGREIVALAPDRDATVTATFSRDVALTADALRSAQVDVAIDVSVAEAVEGNVRACSSAGVPIVVGVTGWQHASDPVLDGVKAAQGAIFIAPNFSIGAVLFSLAVADAASKFSATLGFDAAIIETHHAMKKDAPSGTAKMLATLASTSRSAAVPVSSVRVGHVPGVHTLVLDAPFEQVTLTHEARDRRVFADGAILAARWLHGRRGAFSMHDVVSDLTGGNA